MNYRELFRDVLDSIEMGIQEDVSVGNLKGDEFEVRLFFLDLSPFFPSPPFGPLFIFFFTVHRSY